MSEIESPTLFVMAGSENPRSNSKAVVYELFSLWVEVHRSGRRGPRPVLSPKREKLIAKAVSMYGEETCRDAIRGCALSDWHMGKNPSGKRYDDIELILRDEQKIERFAGMWADSQTGGGFLDED